MNIQIDTVRISGFRGISNIEITLPRVTVLLGQNNAGKTSVIKALQLAIGDYSRYLSDEDFHIGEDEKRQEAITVDLRFIAVDDGARAKEFSEDWQQVFGDKIQSEPDGSQFVAIRTVAKPDRVKGGYIVDRFHLDAWPERIGWQDVRINNKNRLGKRLESVPFIPIDAQRDIHNELKEKSSFVGRVLSSVEYDDKDVAELERMVAEVNKEAIEKSEPLKRLKTHLDNLNQSFEGSGQTELTPFPKKIRDLSKRFSVNFGESDKSSFSMEYHGMGTRSWASMLTVKAFTELLAKNHEEEAEPFFPILAAEEPEAHLHPNAQRTLYRQLIDVPGQVIISTHSPYIAGLAELHEIKSLSKPENSVQVYQLRDEFEDDDLRKLKREVVHSRGELLFSKAIVLSEGETEEQALPELFESYTGKHPFSLGINFVGVNGSGAKYRPFLILAKDLNIPVFIFSDGEEKTVKELKKNYEKVFGATDIEKAPNITILEGTDFEGYLLSQSFNELIEQTIQEIDGDDAIDKWIGKKDGALLKRIRTDKPSCGTCKQLIFEDVLRDYTGDDGRVRAILEILDSSKPLYAKAIADNLIKLPKERFPQKIIELFKQIESGV
ncbi:ATP-dependent nuclease [Xenorhabdus japonica]|uniref:Putative ATP-dependent endonuclease of the OLD family n=1 Tax=Xenorhabdus japonica TaxID=53341 RepID=A0A1I5B2V6_9GAMM|nr:AAA family ATPase [Xenorhabdus japonica]SFN69027.1 putative ATP-dependent endonuclease of the OLD family [Xenorhabdus japonica]